MGADESVEAWWAAQGLEFRRAAEGEAADPRALLARAIEDATIAEAEATGEEGSAIRAWRQSLNDIQQDFSTAHLKANAPLSKAEEAARKAGRTPEEIASDPTIRSLRAEQERISAEWMPRVQAVVAEKPKWVKPREPLFQRSGEVGEPDAFISGLRQVVDAKMPDKLPADGLVNWLAKQAGVKAEELEWTEVATVASDAAARGEKSVAKADVLRWLDDHAVKVGEPWRGGIGPPHVAAAKARLAELFERAKPRVDAWAAARAEELAAEEAENTARLNRMQEYEGEADRLWADVSYPAIQRNDQLGFDSASDAAASIRKHLDWRVRWPDTDITEAEEAAHQVVVARAESIVEA